MDKATLARQLFRVTRLSYDGTRLIWGSIPFKATSGLIDDSSGVVEDARNAKYQCETDKGPIPAGKYKFTLQKSFVPVRTARVPDYRTCALKWSGNWERIPRIADLSRTPTPEEIFCEPFWANWGENRIPLLPADKTTRKRCAPTMRSGFYLHDSTKGYTHGCIEVEKVFFEILKHYVLEMQKKRIMDKTLYLEVVYSQDDVSTYGETDK